MKRSPSTQDHTGQVPSGKRMGGAWSSFLPLFGIFFIATSVRLLWLGDAAFRADTLHFFQWAQQGYTFGTVWSRWSQIMADTAQFPLPAALAVGLADVLPLPPGAFAVRFCDALFGGLAVLFGALIGRELGGRKLMLLAALLWTVSPFHLQVSREAYFYSTLVAGATMLVWAALFISDRERWGNRLPWSFNAVYAAGCLLVAYSHFTGWLIAAFGAGSVLFHAFRRAKENKQYKDAMILMIIPALVAFPLLFLDWALPFFLKDLGDTNAKAESIRIMGEVTEPMLSIVWRYLLTMSWGSWWPGLVMLAIAVAGLGLNVWRDRRSSLQTLLFIMGLCLGAYLVIMKSRGLYVAVRHISFLFPVFFNLMILGIGQMATRLGRLNRAGYALLVSIAFLLLAYPGWHVLHLTGYPTPYREIKTWFDGELPSGTPVLVDRWFEPWNELTVHPTTNVVFTFTSPNEPLDVFIASKWRDEARDFLQNNPDAAYFEVAKSYWDKPEVGPWTWPDEFFKQRAAITNEAGLVLRKLGLAYREDFYGHNTNRVVVEVFFNTREDVLAKYRMEQRKFALFYGSGFLYEKSGPMGIFRFQTQQFMDWRMLDQQGVLEVYNLTEQPVERVLQISGVAPRGAKVIAFQGRRQSFAAGQMQRWLAGPVTLQPGLNKLVLEDPQWERSRQPLLIASVEVVAP